MSKALLLAALLASVAPAAYAADAIDAVPAAPEAVETVVPAGWDGPYIGVMGGAGWLKSHLDFGGGNTSSHTKAGGLIGAFTGYNYQFDNNVVVGVEGDFGYNWNKGTSASTDFGTDWNGAIRGRVGYAMDNALIYGAAGWTVTRGYIDPPTDSKGTKTLNGYTLGLGVDYKFTNNMFARAEYRFNDYGSKDIKGVSFNPQQHEAIIGIGYKF